MIKVSVIVPVYNSQEYISQCADSLLSQTLKDIEIIFVDDGSSDDSVAIIKNIMRNNQDKKILLIESEKNNGPAFSRYQGIKAASGEYILCCDSDDWIESDMLQSMYETGKKDNGDIIGCDIHLLAGNKNKVWRQNFKRDKDEIIKDLLEPYSGFIGFLWNRMIRKDFILKYDIFNVTDLYYWEDLLITIKAHYYANNVSYVDKPFYNYNLGSANSITTHYSPKKIESQIEVTKRIINFLEKEKKLQKFKKQINKRKLLAKSPLVNNINSFDPKRWRNLWPEAQFSDYPKLSHKIIYSLISLKMDKLVYNLLRFRRKK